MDFPQYLVAAEAVSALQKTFACILLILVSFGYGTVIYEGTMTAIDHEYHFYK